MIDGKHWDWETGQKKIPMADWQDRFDWVEEPYASPDGEKVAAIVNAGEETFSVCVNGDTWETDLTRYGISDFWRMDVWLHWYLHWVNGPLP